MDRRSSSAAVPEPGPNIVRAWFDTVINPLLRSLDVEMKYLKRKNWTWRFRPGAFEAIRHASSYLSPKYVDNFKQILSMYPELKKAVSEHDAKVDVLQQRCEQLHNAIKSSQQLSESYQRLTSQMTPFPVPLPMELDPKHIFGAYPPSDHLAVLAQYIVNNLETLPSQYSTATFWNRHKDEFLAIRNHPNFARLYKETTTAGEALKLTTYRLVHILEQLRFQLSLKYDTPVVNPRIPH